MRSISVAGLAKLRTTHGIEPICIVEIDWVDGGTSVYADRTVVSIPGKIVELGEFDDAANISGSGSSQEITIKLDDVDGTIKAILDSHDPHKRPARVYQYFTGLELADKFLLFGGRLTTPIVWNERDRTVTVTILSQLEDQELGFSAEEAGFEYLPAALVNKPWPMIFGTVVNNPALEIVTAISGTTMNPVGILAGEDLMLNLPSTSSAEWSLSYSKEAYHYGFLQNCLIIYASAQDNASQYYQKAVDAAKAIVVVDDVTKSAHDAKQSLAASFLTSFEGFKSVCKQYSDQLTSLAKTMSDSLFAEASSGNCAILRRKKKIAEANTNGLGDNPITILGGEDFPQGIPITLDIEGGLFPGVMTGSSFQIDPVGGSSAELTAKAQGAYNAKLLDTDVCSMNNTTLTAYLTWDAQIPVDHGEDLPFGKSSNTLIDPITGGFYPDYTDTVWLRYTLSEEAVANREPVIQQFWAEPGATATLHTDDQKIWVISTTPGTILAVRALKTVSSSGLVRLVDVPSDLYTVQTTTYGSITAVEVVLQEPLSHIMDEGWQDQLYVTFQSTVGPNIVDIIQYVVTNFTNDTDATGDAGLSCDGASFAHVKTKLAPFPANFAVNDKRNVLAFLKDIAFQSRCALWVSDDIVYLKYLPEQPTPVDTITVSDIEADKGVEVELTPTEDLVTKIDATWRLRCEVNGTTESRNWQTAWNAAPTMTTSEDAVSTKDSTFTITLRHNVKKYGVHEQSYNFYIFNQPDIVYKMATFWLIRKSITWKRIKFTTPLHKLNLETFDAVTLDFAEPYVSSGPITALVESAKYDSANNCIHFQCLCPVAAGTSEQNPYFWPADLPQNVTWPSQADIASGNAGGGNVGTGASGALAIGDTSTITSTVFIGGMNVVFGPYSDRGDPTPTDTGFVAQQTVNPTQYTTSATQKTALDLTVDFPTPTPPLSVSFPDPALSLAGSTTLNINTTQVTDGTNNAPLSSLITAINKQQQIVLPPALHIQDSTGNTGDFTMKNDTPGVPATDSAPATPGVFGAKIAFLEDDTSTT